MTIKVSRGVWGATPRTLDVPIIDETYLGVLPVSSGTIDTFGAWVQISADVGTGKRLLWVGVRQSSGQAPTAVVLEFGAGGSSSESAIGRLNLGYASDGSYFVIPVWLDLADNIRLTVRAKDNIAVTIGYYLGVNIE